MTIRAKSATGDKNVTGAEKATDAKTHARLAALAASLLGIAVLAWAPGLQAAAAGARSESQPVQQQTSGLQAELTLQRAIEAAVEIHPAVRLAQLDVVDAELALDEARAQQLVSPSVTAVPQAEANLEQAQRALDEARRSVAVEVEERMVDLLQAARTLELNEEIDRQAADQVRVMQARLEAGLAQPADVLAAEQDHLRTQADLLKAQGQLQAAQQALSRLIGAYPGGGEGSTAALPAGDASTADASTGGTPSLPSIRLAPLPVREVPKMSLEEVVAEALQRRSEIARAEATLRIRQQELTVAQAAFQTPIAAARARNAAERARIQLEQAKNQVRNDVAQIYAQMVDAGRRLPMYENGFEQARKAAEAARARYEAGLITRLDLDRQLLGVKQAEGILEDARLELNLLVLRFWQSLGRPAPEL